MLAAIRSTFDDILIYTGYTFGELTAMPKLPKGLLPLPSSPQPSSGGLPNEGSAGAAPSAHRRMRRSSTCSSTGPMSRRKTTGVCALRGSTNQRVIVLNPALETLYHEEMQKPRSVQNAVFDGRAISIGIHGRPQTTREKE